MSAEMRSPSDQALLSMPYRPQRSRFPLPLRPHQQSFPFQRQRFPVAPPLRPTFQPGHFLKPHNGIHDQGFHYSEFHVSWEFRDPEFHDSAPLHRRESYDGEFHDMEFHDREFHNRVFPDREFSDREFHDREFHHREFHNRKFYDREFHYREFPDREFYDREFHNREFHDLDFHDRWFHDREFHDREFHNRGFHDREFRDLVDLPFHNREFHVRELHVREFHDEKFHDGEIHNREFHNREFHRVAPFHGRVFHDVAPFHDQEFHDRDPMFCRGEFSRGPRNPRTPLNSRFGNRGFSPTVHRPPAHRRHSMRHTHVSTRQNDSSPKSHQDISSKTGMSQEASLRSPEVASTQATMVSQATTDSSSDTSPTLPDVYETQGETNDDILPYDEDDNNTKISHREACGQKTQYFVDQNGNHLTKTLAIIAVTHVPLFSHICEELLSKDAFDEKYPDTSEDEGDLNMSGTESLHTSKINHLDDRGPDDLGHVDHKPRAVHNFKGSDVGRTSGRGRGRGRNLAEVDNLYHGGKCAVVAEISKPLKFAKEHVPETDIVCHPPSADETKIKTMHEAIGTCVPGGRGRGKPSREKSNTVIGHIRTSSTLSIDDTIKSVSKLDIAAAAAEKDIPPTDGPRGVFKSGGIGRVSGRGRSSSRPRLAEGPEGQTGGISRSGLLSGHWLAPHQTDLLVPDTDNKPDVGVCKVNHSVSDQRPTNNKSQTLTSAAVDAKVVQLKQVAIWKTLKAI